MFVIDQEIKKDSSESAAKSRTTVVGMILFNNMIGKSLIDSPYMQGYMEMNAELEKISSQVEIGLFTHAWLTG